MGRPIDTGLGLAHPALIGRAAFVLRRFGRAARHDQISGLHQRFHSEREDLVEIERAGSLVGSDRHAFLQDHRPFVETGGRAEDRQSGLAASADDRPWDRRRPAMQWQQRGVELDHSVFRNGAELRRREQQDIGHYTEIGVELGERLFCFIARVFGMAMDRQPAFLRRHDERVGSGTRPLRRCKHAGYLVPAGDKGLQHGFTESLLADDYDAHLVSSDYPARQQSFMLKRPRASLSLRVRPRYRPRRRVAAAGSPLCRGRPRCGSKRSLRIGEQTHRPS